MRSFIYYVSFKSFWHVITLHAGETTHTVETPTFTTYTHHSLTIDPLIEVMGCSNQSQCLTQLMKLRTRGWRKRALR